MLKKMCLFAIFAGFLNGSVARADQEGYNLYCFGFDRKIDQEFQFWQRLDAYFQPSGRFFAQVNNIALQGNYTPRVFRIEPDGERLMNTVMTVFDENGNEAFSVNYDSARVGRNKMSAKIYTIYGAWSYSSRATDVQCGLSRG